MPRLLSLLALAVAALLAAPAAAPVAQQVEGIAAVVNDDVVSMSDLRFRLRLALMGAGLQPTEANQQRLMPLVLRGLIDERLQQAEAARYGIEVTPEELQSGLQRIADQNGMSAGQLLSVLAQNGISPSTMEDQVRTGIAWGKLVSNRLMPTVNIGQEEIDEVIARIEANRGLPEYLLAEIFLGVDNPANEAEIASFAQAMVTEIRRGARFSALARQFSQSADAQNGGDLGWVLQGQLDPALEAAVATMQRGEVTDPIRLLDGYHILLLRDQRRVATADPGDSVLQVYQIGLGFAGGQSRAMAAAEAVVREVRGCEQFRRRAEDLGVADGLDLGSGRLRDMSPALRSSVELLPVGEPSQPQVVQGGVLVHMVCSRQDPPSSGIADRSAIANTLGQQRLDMLQRRYMRDLRNAAFIDVRI